MKKVLIIGFGSIGTRHYNILKCILPNSTIDIVSKHFNGTLNNSTVFKSLKDIPSLNAYEYIIIASETIKHYEQLKYIEAKANNKIILVEKPLFDIYREYKFKNNKVFVAYNLRYHPIIQELRKITLKEEPIYVNAIVGQYLPYWRPNRDYKTTYSASKEKGGGVLLDLSHEIDYVQWIAGNIENIFAINKKVSSLEITSEDLAVLSGTTEKGTVVNISLDYISRVPIRQIILHTQYTSYLGNFIDNYLLVKSSNKEEKIFFTIDKNYTYKKMHEDIIARKYTYICSFAEGLKTVKLIHNIRSKCKDGIYLQQI